MATTIEEIQTLVEQLPPTDQQKVLELAQRLAEMQRFLDSLPKSTLPPGTPGNVLLEVLQRFQLPLEAVEAMERAIEDCERVEMDEY